jgi:hypothetical protein
MPMPTTAIATSIPIIMHIYSNFMYSFLRIDEAIFSPFLLTVIDSLIFLCPTFQPSSLQFCCEILAEAAPLNQVGDPLRNNFEFP